MNNHKQKCSTCECSIYAWIFNCKGIDGIVHLLKLQITFFNLTGELMHRLSLTDCWYNCIFLLIGMHVSWMNRKDDKITWHRTWIRARHERFMSLRPLWEFRRARHDAFFNSAKCNNCGGRCPLQSRQMRIPAGQFTSFLGLAWSARCTDGGGYPRGVSVHLHPIICSNESPSADAHSPLLCI